MAAELEKLRQDVRNLAKQFKDAGQDNLAALLDVDAQSFGAKAKIANSRGFITFAQDSHARPQEDIFTALGLTPKQVAQHPDQITEDMVRKTPFTGNPRDVELVWLDGYDVGLTEVTTTTNRFERGEALGLEKCHQEVGIYQRFADKGQPLNTWYYMAMETIADRHGFPYVFLLGHDASGLWLYDTWATPDGRWDPGNQLVFALPQVKA